MDNDNNEPVQMPPTMDIPPSTGEDTGNPTPITPSTTPGASQPSSPPQAATAPPTDQPNISSVKIKPPGTGSKPSILLIALGLVVVLVIGGLGYLYYTNLQLKNNSGQEEQTTKGEGEEDATAFDAEQIQIVDGNVYRVLPLGKSRVLVDKTQYPETGIIGFVQVVVSPDNSKLCFVSLPPAPEPATYISNVDGTEVTKVAGNAASCNWYKDSKKIVYLKSDNETQTKAIYVYDIESKAETNLTEGLAPEGVLREYEITGLSEDGDNVLCFYRDTNLSEGEEERKPCEVPITPRSSS